MLCPVDLTELNPSLFDLNFTKQVYKALAIILLLNKIKLC